MCQANAYEKARTRICALAKGMCVGRPLTLSTLPLLIAGVSAWLVNMWSTCLEVAPDKVTRDASFPPLPRSTSLDSTEGDSGVVMTLDPNSKE